jgi:WD repeat-containing protein 90
VMETRLEFSFKPPLQTLHSISLNDPLQADQYYLCLSGKDFQKRDVILIYSFTEMLKQKRVEIYARQLCDFDMSHIRFNDALPTSLVACGRESIRFFKIKNGHLPGQSVTLNNTGRGKLFTRSIVDYTESDKGQRKPQFVFVTTSCGLLYFVNYATR